MIDVPKARAPKRDIPGLLGHFPSPNFANSLFPDYLSRSVAIDRPPICLTREDRAMPRLKGQCGILAGASTISINPGLTCQRCR